MRNRRQAENLPMSESQWIHFNSEELKEKINLETGRIDWQELQGHFARGVVVVLAADLDLVEVAARFAEDDKSRVEAWAKLGKIHRASTADAKRWQKTESSFWASVVAPWVLVQEITLH